MKGTFDPRKPADHDPLSASDMRNIHNALFQGDIAPLRPRCHYDIDAMEYPTDGAAAAVWSGTGCTVTMDNANNIEGSRCIQVVVDATGNREVSRSWNGDISGFYELRVWVRANATSQIQFFVQDSSGNRSYWDINISSADTWNRYSLILSSPDGNNGSPADLSDITSIGYQSLDASITYLFDLIEARTGMNVYVESALAGDNYFRQVWWGNAWLGFAGGVSPDITAPTTNPRIDMLCLNTNQQLEWVVGTENIAPPLPALPEGYFPICYVYCRPTMSRVVDYEERDDYPNDGYILADIRRFYMAGGYPIITVANYADLPSGAPSGILGYVTDEPNIYIKRDTGWELLDRRLVNSYLWVRGENAPGSSSDAMLLIGGDTSHEISIVFEQGYNDEPHLKWYPTYPERRKFVISEGSPSGSGTERAIATIPIQTDDIQDAAITAAKIADGVINAAKLSIGSGSITHNPANPEAAIGYSLADSDYMFYPRMQVDGIAETEYKVMGTGGEIKFVSEGHWMYGKKQAHINIKRVGFTETITVYYKYVTGTSDTVWIFLLVDTKTGHIHAVWYADDPPEFGSPADPKFTPFHTDLLNEDSIVVVVADTSNFDEIRARCSRNRPPSRVILEEFQIDWQVKPRYTPRSIIKADEYGDLEGEKIATLRDGRILRRQVIERLPEELEFRRLKKRK